MGACGKPPDEGWLGYGEGDSAMISAPQPGWVTDLKVERGQTVRRGDLLFVLDSTQQQASRDQAQASLAQEVGLALGAQAGEARLREVLTEAGFGRVRRATETPFNMVLEVRV